MSQKLANFINHTAGEVLKSKENFSAGLAGGRTPKRTYEIMRNSFEFFGRSEFFPTDERYVPSEDPKSNYRFLRESLGDRSKIYRVRTDLPPQEACRDFGEALGRADQLDFVLLGLGADGHTASIFPGVPCKPCSENACTSISPDGLERISMSMDFINRSTRIVFLVLGEEKREALEKLLRGEDIPASRVRKDAFIFTDIHSPSSNSSFSISK